MPRGSLSHWVKSSLAEEGVDVAIYGAHGTHTVSTSATEKHTSLVTVLKAGGWSSENTFTCFYKRLIPSEGKTASSFGQVVVVSFLKKADKL